MKPSVLPRAGLVAASVLLAGCAAASGSGGSTAGSAPSGGASGGTSSSPTGGGTSSAPSGGASSSPTTGSPGSLKGTSLKVTVLAEPGVAAQSWTLTCDPPGGTHPQAGSACAQLAAYSATSGDPFAETPPGVMCSMIYGGDQKATVTGTYRGKPVNTRFSRTNGCETTRWDRVSKVLVVNGGVPNALG
jgi:Subtilisin inhibitor-like